jgi:hypothetical protein
MTDYQTEYAAFRAEVLSRVLPMPRVPWHYETPLMRLNPLANVRLPSAPHASAKQIVADWLEWDAVRDAEFIKTLETKFPTLCKSGE